MSKTQIPPQILEVESAIGTQICHAVHILTHVTGHIWSLKPYIWIKRENTLCFFLFLPWHVNWLINSVAIHCMLNKSIWIEVVILFPFHCAWSKFLAVLWTHNPKEKDFSNVFQREELPPQCIFAWASWIGIKCIISVQLWVSLYVIRRNIRSDSVGIPLVGIIETT